MKLDIKALSRWPQATLLGDSGLDFFANSSSGFERCLERDKTAQQQAKQLAATLRSCKRLLLLGIGGSAMGMKALCDALAEPHEAERLVILDHLDLGLFERAVEGIDDVDLGLIIISRSGGTIEVLAWLREILGRRSPANVVCITASPDSPIGRMASQYGWPSASIPDDVGGRFSVFTPCGLLPAAALGIDTDGLLRGAKQVDPLVAHQLAADLKFLFDGGHERVLQFFYGEALKGLAGWWMQLLNESLGKAGLPLFFAAANGPRDQHSLLQLLMQGADRQALIFTRWQTPPQAPAEGPDLAKLGSCGLAELEQTLFEASSQALDGAGRPVFVCQIESEAEALGALMQTWMRCTAQLGNLLDINPFDQPGVEDAKLRAKETLARRRL
jgi:glucose-6-phosphate isomerase